MNIQLTQTIESYWKKWLGPSMASGLIKVLSMVTSFLIMIVLGRNGGPATLGLYALGQTCLQLLVLVAGFGLPSYLVRQFSWSLSSKQTEVNIFTEYCLSFGLVIIFGTGIALGLFLNASFLSEKIFQNVLYTEVLRWVALAIVPYTLLLLHTEVLRGLGFPIQSQALQAFLVPTLTLICIGIGLLKYVDFPTASETMSLYTYSSFVGAVLTFFCTLIKIKKRSIINANILIGIQLRKIIQNTFTLIHKGKVFLIAGVAMTVLNMTDTIMLGLFSSPVSVGQYNAASRLAGSLGIILFSVNNILVPKIGKSFAAGNKLKFSTQVETGISLAFWPTLLAAGILLIFSSEILSIFGKEFQEGCVILRILAVGALINALSGPVGWVLCMSGHEALFQRVLLVAAGLNIILNLILIPLYGAVGAALTTTVCTALWNVVSAVIASRKLGVCCVYGCKGFLERCVDE